MKKVLLIAVAAALIVGAAFTGSASARERGDRSDRAALTANQIVAEMDARTARIKADLRLTPEQEKNWPGFESAVRDISKNRADRLVAFRAERAQRKESDDVIAYLKSNANYLGDRSADVKKLAAVKHPQDQAARN